MSTSPGKYTREVCSYISSRQFEELPESVVEAAKLVTLDILGSALAASDSGMARSILQFAGAQGGVEESSLIGGHARTTRTIASLVNGAISADAELDDVHPYSNIHASSVFVPSMLAIAEARSLSGRDFINGLVIAYDIGCRVSEALTDEEQGKKGFHPTGISGCFGSVAGAAAVLGFTPDQVDESIGLAGTQAGGLLTYRLESGHYTKSLHSGLAARAGITATQLVENGFRGPQGTLDGTENVFKAYSDGQRYERLVDALGDRYEIEHTGFKFYGSCRAIHVTLDVILPLIRAGRLSADDIQEIEVWLPTRQVPNVDNNALLTHNLQYVVAVTLLDGGLTENQLAEDRRADPTVAALMSRIRLLSNDEMNKVYPHHWPCRVRVATVQGDVIDESLQDPKGNPGNPATLDDIEVKFRDLAKRALGSAAMDALAQSIRSLEEVKSMESIGMLLRSTEPTKTAKVG